MDNNFYTSLTFERKNPDDFGPLTAKITEVAWDGDIFKLFSMFRGIVVSAGYSDESYYDAMKEILAEQGYTISKEE